MWALVAFLGLFPLSLQAEQTALEANHNPAWTRLHHHFQALGRDPSAPPLRILHIGDSHTAAAAFSGRVQELIQRRFGDSGPGILPPGELSNPPQGQFRPRQSDGWVSKRERKPDTAAGGALGGFAAYSQRPYQFLGYNLPNGNREARLILYTDPEEVARPSRFKVFHDKREIPPITRSSKGRSFYALPAGNGHLEILSGGSGETPRLRALGLLNETPGVSYCALGINGASLGILQEWYGATVRMQMADYRPDLLILAFGTNDVVAPGFTRDGFVRTLRLTEAWINEYAPQSAVLMILPPGLPKHDLRVQENLSTLREEIRFFSRKNGWFVWDWSRSINSIGRFPTGVEAFYSRDGIHLTSAGYSQSASQLFDALSTVF